MVHSKRRNLVMTETFCYRILYHFHKNDSSHVHAKVSPPRLNGARTGVFGTRSPHRPSPIGLSLVTINRVEGKYKMTANGACIARHVTSRHIA